LWQLPAGPAILFDELDIKGTATLKDATFDDVRAALPRLRCRESVGRERLAGQTITLAIALAT
jgi:hypothetical protein